jgi:DHA2 family multidrug resistance protein
MSPLNQPYNTLLQQTESTLRTLHTGAPTGPAAAAGVIYQTFIKQSQVLAYTDVFRICAVAAFCIVPLTFLFTNYKPAPGQRGPAAH